MGSTRKLYRGTILSKVLKGTQGCLDFQGNETSKKTELFNSNLNNKFDKIETKYDEESNLESKKISKINGYISLIEDSNKYYVDCCVVLNKDT